jgi:hypothetical protein
VRLAAPQRLKGGGGFRRRHRAPMRSNPVPAPRCSKAWPATSATRWRFPRKRPKT